VLAAGADDSRAAEAALSRLCQAYWYPLYAFVRRLGYTPHDAEDATQGFFADLMRREALDSVDQAKGRFRSFLMAAMKNFLAHQRERAHAQKRGGGQVLQALDATDVEQRYLLEPADTASPDKLFDRRWALTVLDRARAALRTEYEDSGRARLFQALTPLLSAARAAPYAELAPAVGMSEGALKVAAHRLRKRYREVLREEIAQTVSQPSDVDSELRHLMEALSD
jgi:RNA polymerase sigma factor (sigma-70 family)